MTFKKRLRKIIDCFSPRSNQSNLYIYVNSEYAFVLYSVLDDVKNRECGISKWDSNRKETKITCKHNKIGICSECWSKMLEKGLEAVSYTHLTLPTKRIV